MKRLLYFLAIVVCTLPCAGLSAKVQRVVSLGPSITEELFELGVEEKIVGCTTYCRLKGLENVERVGTVINVDMERVVALRPDIVFATSLTDPRAVKKMKTLGIRVVIFHEPKSFQEICQQFMELSRLVGKEHTAEEILQRVKEEVNRIRSKVKHLRKTKVFVEIGVKPLFTVKKGTFIDDLITFAGGVNIAGSSATGIYSVEDVVRKNPDVIIIVTMGLSGKEKDMWLRFKNMKAVKDGRIYVVDSYKVCSPTPLRFLESLREFVKLLHPEVER